MHKVWSILHLTGEAALTASLWRALVIGLFAGMVLGSDILHVAAQDDSPNRAALVVVHGDGRVVTRCVAFVEAQITGLELVQRTDLDLNLEASGMGATICRLDGEGCTYPQQSCFCQCEGENCVYWSYWHSQAGAWVYSNLGAANSVVAPGALEGWVWGAGTVDTAQSPPTLTFDAICAAPTATSTPTHTVMPTLTGTPTPTATLMTETSPTASWTPSPTASFTPAPTISAPTLASSTPIATVTPLPTPTSTPFTTPLLAAPGAALSPPVIVAFAADRREILAGETVIVRWQVTNAEAVTLQAVGKTVSIPAAGELTLAPPQNTTYLLAAANAGGATSTAMTIIVRPRPTPPTDMPPLIIAPPPTNAPLTAGTASVPLTPSPTPMTALTAPTAAPTAAPLATLTAPPTATLTATLTAAPVALVAAPPGDRTSVVTTPLAQPAPVTSLLFTIVGGVAILGIPLVGLALFLLFMALRRM